MSAPDFLAIQLIVVEECSVNPEVKFKKKKGTNITKVVGSIMDVVINDNSISC